MEQQDTVAAYFFKLWPKIEANWVRIAWGGGVILVAAGLISFHSWQRDQKEISAGQALTQAEMSMPRNATPGQEADLYLKVAADYQGTSAGQRALLQGAAMLFAAGKYDDAQTQFQKFLGTYPGSYFAAQAELGVATSLDAQGKMDAAAAAYQQIIKTESDPIAANSARFGLAQIEERQGKLADAMNHYEDIMHAMPNSPMSSQAAMRAMALKAKLQSPASSTTPAAPFKLNH